MPRLAPPKSFKYENHIEILRHLDFFRSWGGGQSGTLTFFRNRLLTGQHSANSRGGQLKKSPCTMIKLRSGFLYSNVYLWFYSDDFCLWRGTLWRFHRKVKETKMTSRRKLKLFRNSSLIYIWGTNQTNLISINLKSSTIGLVLKLD